MCSRITWCTWAVLLGIIQLAQGATILFYRTIDDYDRVPMDQAETILSLDGYDNSLCLVIYIHGFANSVSSNISVTVLTAHLADKTLNVCALDWEEEASTFGISITDPVAYVTSAIPKMLIVAKELAKAVAKMVIAGLNLPCLVLTGHSLGAQMVCKTSEYLKSDCNLTSPGYAFLLDPAGPGFDFTPLGGVTKECGDNVRVVSTNPGGYGSVTSDGHVIIFSRTIAKLLGPGNIQPGCQSVQSALIPFDGCSHNRAPEFYAEMVNPPTKGSLQCCLASNYEEWLRGRADCTKPVTLSLDMDEEIRGNCYMQTFSESPYGMYENGTTPSEPFPSPKTTD